MFISTSPNQYFRFSFMNLEKLTMPYMTSVLRLTPVGQRCYSALTGFMFVYYIL